MRELTSLVLTSSTHMLRVLFKQARDAHNMHKGALPEGCPHFTDFHTHNLVGTGWERHPGLDLYVWFLPHVASFYLHSEREAV